MPAPERRQASRLAEIGLDHLGIGLHLGGGAVGDHLAVVEHRDAVGHGHDHVDMMLDQDDGHAAIGEAADQLHQVLDLAMRQAGGGLVEQQQLRPQRQRARDLEAPLVAEGQVARLLVGEVGEADEVEQPPRLGQRRALLARGSAAGAARSRRRSRGNADAGRPARSPARSSGRTIRCSGSCARCRGGREHRAAGRRRSAPNTVTSPDVAR